MLLLGTGGNTAGDLVGWQDRTGEASLKDRTRKHTFIFVGFTAEEHGLVGSAYYVAHMGQADVERTRAMVNLDTLALGPTAGANDPWDQAPGGFGDDSAIETRNSLDHRSEQVHDVEVVGDGVRN